MRRIRDRGGFDSCKGREAEVIVNQRVTDNALKLVSASVDKIEVQANVGQATKGTRGIPWHQQPKKDVEDHDRPGVAVNRR